MKILITLITIFFGICTNVQNTDVDNVSFKVNQDRGNETNNFEIDYELIEMVVPGNSKDFRLARMESEEYASTFRISSKHGTDKPAPGNEESRPPVWGIAKMTFLVSDFQIARDYYGEFLGFEEALSYPSAIGEVISFKVNDRQFLEFVEDKDAKEKPRLVSVSFETDNIEQMRLYLQGKGVKVPSEVTKDEAGNEVILIHDPSGIPVEFMRFGENSIHKLSKGKFLSERRISKRIHHVGLYCKEVVDDDAFWVGIMGCKELWRYPEDHQEKIQMNYLHFSDCVENIEHYPSDDVNFSHPCFLVEDMQETIYTLKERRGNNQLAKPIVAKGKRWLLNLQNEDGTKVEFTEAHIVR